MTLDQFHKKLKSRSYISTNNKKEHYTFRFTEVHLFRDDEYLCDYNLSEKDGDFKIIFTNLNSNITSNGFQNVLFIIDSQSFVVNRNSSLFGGKYDVIMEAQK